MAAEKRRLLLTLCSSNGPYSHAVVPLPDSFQAAKNEAVQSFSLEGNNVVLKYAMKRANGTGAWASFHPRDWNSLVAQDGEIGVFLMDSLDLPYEPTSGENVANEHVVSSGGSNTPPRPPKILHLICESQDGEEESAIIKAPPTYVECQNLAYEALRNYIPHDAKAVDLQLAANTSSLVQWSVITPSAYNAVLARTTDSLDIHVSIHYD